MKKILFIVTVFVLAIIMVIPSGVLAETDTVTGQFVTAQNEPSVNVTLCNSDGTSPVTVMTPGMAYDVKVNVTDPDGKANLDTITLKVWYDADGGVPTSTEFDAITANATTAIIYTWTESTGLFVFTEESGSSWAENTTSSAPTSLPGDFEFKFTVGNVATETTGSANWQIAVKVVDDDPNTVFAYDTDTGTNDMNFYSGIAVASTTVDWGLVSAGMDFGDNTTSELNAGNITYIANGAYNKIVSTTATWSITGDTAELDENGVCSSPNQFALKADDTGTLASAVLVTTTGATIGSGTITSESGLTDATNGLWLKLASVFAGGTFSGNITYTISN